MAPLISDSIKSGRCPIKFRLGVRSVPRTINGIFRGEGAIINVLANVTKFFIFGAGGIVPYVVTFFAIIRTANITDVDMFLCGVATEVAAIFTNARFKLGRALV